MSDWSLTQLAAHQLVDFWSLQLSSVAFFVLCGIEMALLKRLSFSLRPDQTTDMFYWLLTPQVRIVSRMVALGLLVPLALLLGISMEAATLDGFGPVARQPKVLIIAELVLLMDLATYWVHRLFHAVPYLWRFHAIHHSATEVTWSTTGRVHPINEIGNYLATVVPFALLGFPINLTLPTAPAVIAIALLAHSDLKTSYGPLAAVIVSPRFHRWHHTHSEVGGNKNFANVFAFWDRLFGTYFLPADRLPEKFGLDTDGFPQRFLAQLVEPWRDRRGRDETEQDEPSMKTAAGS